MILIKNVTALTLVTSKVLRNADILIEKDKIVYVGPTKDHKRKFEKVIDGSGFLALPGFVNTHSHLAMTLMRGYGEGCSLQSWLNDFIYPIEEKLTEDDIYFGTLLALIESVKTGSTTVSDFYIFPHKSVQAVKEVGLRANIGFSLASKPGLDLLLLKKAEGFVNKFNGIENGRLLASFAPHAPYSCTVKLLKETAKVASEMDSIVQIHLHETKKEIIDYKKIHKVSPIEKLEEIDFFKAQVLAAHCIHVSESEIKILKDNNVGISVNPQSNLKLGSGIPMVDKLFKEDLKISVGTDGPSSNNNLSILEDLRLIALLAKGTSMEPDLIKPLEALRIGTVNGAINLGFKNVGLLKEGFKADLILVNKNNVNFMPETDYLSHVIYSMYPTDVDYMFVDGNLIMENKKLTTIDEDEVKREFQKHHKRLSKFSQ